MLKASTGSSGSTALGKPMRAPDCASNWRGRSGLPRSPRIKRSRPIRGVVEARSLTNIDDLQNRQDSGNCFLIHAAEKSIFIVPLPPPDVQMAPRLRRERHLGGSATNLYFFPSALGAGFAAGFAGALAAFPLNSTKITSNALSPVFSGRWTVAGVNIASPAFTVRSSVLPSG